MSLISHNFGEAEERFPVSAEDSALNENAYSLKWGKGEEKRLREAFEKGKSALTKKTFLDNKERAKAVAMVLAIVAGIALFSLAAHGPLSQIKASQVNAPSFKLSADPLTNDILLSGGMALTLVAAIALGIFLVKKKEHLESLLIYENENKDVVSEQVYLNKLYALSYAFELHNLSPEDFFGLIRESYSQEGDLATGSRTLLKDQEAFKSVFQDVLANDLEKLKHFFSRVSPAEKEFTSEELFDFFTFKRPLDRLTPLLEEHRRLTQRQHLAEDIGKITKEKQELTENAWESLQASPLWKELKQLETSYAETEYSYWVVANERRLEQEHGKLSFREELEQLEMFYEELPSLEESQLLEKKRELEEQRSYWRERSFDTSTSDDSNNYFLRFRLVVNKLEVLEQVLEKEGERSRLEFSLACTFTYEEREVLGDDLRKVDEQFIQDIKKQRKILQEEMLALEAGSKKSAPDLETQLQEKKQDLEKKLQNLERQLERELLQLEEEKQADFERLQALESTLEKGFFTTEEEKAKAAATCGELKRLLPRGLIDLNDEYKAAQQELADLSFEVSREDHEDYQKRMEYIFFCLDDELDAIGKKGSEKVAILADRLKRSPYHMISYLLAHAHCFSREDSIEEKEVLKKVFADVTSEQKEILANILRSVIQKQNFFEEVAYWHVFPENVQEIYMKALASNEAFISPLIQYKSMIALDLLLQEADPDKYCDNSLVLEKLRQLLKSNKIADENSKIPLPNAKRHPLTLAKLVNDTDIEGSEVLPFVREMTTKDRATFLEYLQDNEENAAFILEVMALERRRFSSLTQEERKMVHRVFKTHPIAAAAFLKQRWENKQYREFALDVFFQMKPEEGSIFLQKVFYTEEETVDRQFEPFMKSLLKRVEGMSRESFDKVVTVFAQDNSYALIEAFATLFDGSTRLLMGSSSDSNVYRRFLRWKVEDVRDRETDLEGNSEDLCFKFLDALQQPGTEIELSGSSLRTTVEDLIVSEAIGNENFYQRVFQILERVKALEGVEEALVKAVAGESAISALQKQGFFDGERLPLLWKITKSFYEKDFHREDKELLVESIIQDHYFFCHGAGKAFKEEWLTLMVSFLKDKPRLAAHIFNQEPLEMIVSAFEEMDKPQTEKSEAKKKEPTTISMTSAATRLYEESQKERGISEVKKEGPVEIQEETLVEAPPSDKRTFCQNLQVDSLHRFYASALQHLASRVEEKHQEWRKESPEAWKKDSLRARENRQKAFNSFYKKVQVPPSNADLLQGIYLQDYHFFYYGAGKIFKEEWLNVIASYAKEHPQWLAEYFTRWAGGDLTEDGVSFEKIFALTMSAFKKMDHDQKRTFHRTLAQGNPNFLKLFYQRALVQWEVSIDEENNRRRKRKGAALLTEAEISDAFQKEFLPLTEEPHLLEMHSIFKERRYISLKKTLSRMEPASFVKAIRILDAERWEQFSKKDQMFLLKQLAADPNKVEALIQENEKVPWKPFLPQAQQLLRECIQPSSQERVAEILKDSGSPLTEEAFLQQCQTLIDNPEQLLQLLVQYQENPLSYLGDPIVHLLQPALQDFEPALSILPIDPKYLTYLLKHMPKDQKPGLVHALFDRIGDNGVLKSKLYYYHPQCFGEWVNLKGDYFPLQPILKELPKDKQWSLLYGIALNPTLGADEGKFLSVISRCIEKIGPTMVRQKYKEEIALLIAYLIKNDHLCDCWKAKSKAITDIINLTWTAIEGKACFSSILQKGLKEVVGMAAKVNFATELFTLVMQSDLYSEEDVLLRVLQEKLSEKELRLFDRCRTSEREVKPLDPFFD